MWTYRQSTGWFDEPSGVSLVRCYAGNGLGKNNPAMQNVKFSGPLPCGMYTMTALEQGHHTGPDTIVLTPDPENEMFDRGSFRIHGDSIQEPGTASDGCIVMEHASRMEVWNSSDHRLQVTS